MSRNFIKDQNLVIFSDDTKLKSHQSRKPHFKLQNPYLKFCQINILPNTVIRQNAKYQSH